MHRLVAQVKALALEVRRQRIQAVAHHDHGVVELGVADGMQHGVIRSDQLAVALLVLLATAARARIVAAHLGPVSYTHLDVYKRQMYSREKIDSFNELAWGGGYGRSIYDEDGDWQGLYAMAFLDSHSKVEPIAGYGFLKIGRVSENFRLGAGYTVFLTARHDTMSYVPFPGVLPLVSAGYKLSLIHI